MSGLARHIMGMGFRPSALAGPPYSAWQLTDDPNGPWGIRSGAGVNCLGRFCFMEGDCFAPRRIVEELVELMVDA